MLLAWHELFASNTPDSFRPRFCDPLSLAAELRQVAERARQSIRWKQHIEVLQKELKTSLRADRAVFSSHPRDLWSMTKAAESTDPNKVLHFLTSVEFTEAQYSQAAGDLLRQAALGLPTKKAECLGALRRWGTLVLRDERSTIGPASSLARENYLSLQPSEIAEKIIASRSPISKRFACILALIGATEPILCLLEKTGFVVQDVCGGLISELRASLPPKTHLVRVEVDSPTREGALRTAVRLIRDAFDIYNFYANRTALNIGPTALVQAHEEWRKLTVGDPGFRRLEQRANSLELTCELLETNVRERFGGRIWNALEHYSLAHASAAPRVKPARKFPLGAIP